MSQAIYEVLKEYKVQLENRYTPVFGRVLKRISGDDELNVSFQWEVSHYYKPTDGGTIYKPSHHAESAERAETALLNYLKAFNEEDILENEMY